MRDHFLRGIYQDEVSSLDGRNGQRPLRKSSWRKFSPETARKTEPAGGGKCVEENRLMIWKNGKTSQIGPGNLTLDGKVVDSWDGDWFTARGIGRNDWGRISIHRCPLTDADVKPGRLLDHEILSRFFNYLCWLVMALSLGLTAAYRFRVSALSRRLGARMAELLRPADWAWIVGLGILLPFAYVMGINRLTPLGGREFGMRGTALPMPAGHFLGLLVLWLVVPVQIIRWRLAKRAGGFGFSGPSRIGWVAVVCAVAFVPWIGWIAISAPHLSFW